MNLPVNPVLQSLQSKIQALPQAQKLSVKVEAIDDLLKVTLNRSATTQEQQPNYDSVWESLRLFLRLSSKDLKGVFTQFMLVGRVEEKQEWSNSSSINSNGMIANTQQETIIAGIAIPLIVLVVLVVANFSKGTSTSPITPSVQTKDPNCLYIPESSVPRGMSYGDYKDKVKRETGAKCVFFTGG